MNLIGFCSRSLANNETYQKSSTVSWKICKIRKIATFEAIFMLAKRKVREVSYSSQIEQKTAKKIKFQCQRVFYYTHVVLCHTIWMRTGFACVDPGLESNSGPFPWSAIRWSIVKTGYITKTRICPCASILQSLTTDSKFVDILQTLMINSQIVYLLLTLMINS